MEEHNFCKSCQVYFVVWPFLFSKNRIDVEEDSGNRGKVFSGHLASKSNRWKVFERALCPDDWVQGPLMNDWLTD